MAPIELSFTGAHWLSPDGIRDDALNVAAGRIVDAPARRVDLRGKLILPGIVDLHGDGFERHIAPRRGALKDIASGIVSTERELAANGITTAVLAQFYSWEGGLRSPETARRVAEALAATAAGLATDMGLQLRLETHMLDDHDAALTLIERLAITYVAFNDHLPHDHLNSGKRPPRLTGTALKSGRNPEKHLALMHALHDRASEVPAALDALCARLSARGVLMASHDDQTAEDVITWRQRGVRLSEFPETVEAAQAAHDHASPVILGAPNVVRGASHKGKVSARDLIAENLGTALASDYHYPALQNAVRELVAVDLKTLETAWPLISTNPARILNLTDRGSLAAGQRADLVIFDADSMRIEATIAGGRFSYLTGDTAHRCLSFASEPPLA